MASALCTTFGVPQEAPLHTRLGSGVGHVGMSRAIFRRWETRVIHTLTIYRWKITILNGKIHYKWPFSIAMSAITRGYNRWIIQFGYWHPMKNPPFPLFLHHLPAQLLSNSGSDDPLEGVELPELPAPHSLARTPRAKQLEALPGLPMPEENGRAADPGIHNWIRHGYTDRKLDNDK